jgi:alpha-tubulin suppressor-like RCC1 family protein
VFIECIPVLFRWLALTLGLLAPVIVRADVIAMYMAGNEVPLSLDRFTASGNAVHFTLNYAPTPGTQLMVVQNTGINFINGTFMNLAQGQTVALTYNGTPYNFVANYYGGTGNDLVLVWKETLLYAWGENGTGKLGINSTTNSPVPVAVTNTGGLAGKTVLSLAAGYNHSVAVCSDGTVATWGYSTYGTSSRVPEVLANTGVLFGKTVVAVDAGATYSVALCTDGTVAAWGANASGQLGDNSTSYSSVPVAVTTTGVLFGKTVVAVAAGYSHSVALCSDGTVAAWGANDSGQLGNNSTTFSSVPVAVTKTGVLFGKTVVAVAAGWEHSVALCSDGTVATWGSNYFGQLGNNSTINSNVPVAVDRVGGLGGKTVAAVAAGGNHTIALCSDGTIASWGGSYYGQLGNGSTTSSSVPVAVDRTGVLVDKTVVAVSAGYLHSVALCSDGTVAAWGGNSDGQLGNNSTINSNIPVAVTKSGGMHFYGLFHGSTGYHGLALVALELESPSTLVYTRNSATYAKGWPIPINTPSSIGGAVVSYAVSPALPAGLTLDLATGVISGTPTAVVAPASYTVTATNSVGSTTSTLNIAVDDIAPPLTATYTTGREVPLIVSRFTATGSTVSFTLNYAPTTGTQLMVVKNTGPEFINGTFSNLAQGQTVALTYNGKLYNFVANYYGGTGKDLVLVWHGTLPYAWGENDYGQLGNNSSTNNSTPMAVTNTGVLAGKTVVAVAAGGDHSVALCSDSTVVTWGANDNGQLGSGYGYDRLVPVAVWSTGVLDGKTVVAVAAGYRHSVSLCSDGTVVSWGANYYGQLGNNSTTGSYLPVEVNNTGVLAGKAVVAVAAGVMHTIALCSDGTLAAWGYNDYGQLGNNNTTSSLVPVAVDMSGVLAGKTVVAVSAGFYHSVALCSDGTVASWGSNSAGQLGNNNTTTSLVPVAVNTSSGMSALYNKTVVAVTADPYYNVALCADGTVATWGSSYGFNSNVPVVMADKGGLAGKTVVTVSAGFAHSVALCSDGTVAAWGSNYYGQLGNNSTNPSSVPVAVTNVTGVHFTGIFSGSGGNHSLDLVALDPPSALVYATNPATYAKDTSITNNMPSSSGGPVDSYSISPSLSAGLTFNTSTGIISGTPTAVAATASYTVTATNSVGSTTATVNIVVNGPNLDAWASGYGLTGLTALASADPDGDGVTNLVEYALGLNPTLADSNPIQLSQITVEGSTYLQLSVIRNSAVTNVMIEGLSAGTLSNPDAWSTSTTLIVTDSASVFTVRDSLPIETNSKRFLKLRFTLQ